MDASQFQLLYRRDGIVKISSTTNDQLYKLPSSTDIKSLADEVLRTGSAIRVIETSENILVSMPGAALGDAPVVETRRVVSRIENFVSFNKHWTDLCVTGGALSAIVGLVCADDGDDTEPWCLYKEKLNIKPPGSGGFAAHLDTPSLRVTGLCDRFVTVMIAIDDMTADNGCLQVCRGAWSEDASLPCDDIHETGTGSNPDGNGRRGSIASASVSQLQWESIECKSGDVYIFSGWLPHKSASNTTNQPRRAVFLTYNHSEDGELEETYYRIMRDMRSAYAKQLIIQQGGREKPIHVELGKSTAAPKV